MYLLLGPTLVLVGMYLVGLIQINLPGGGVSERLTQRIDAMGIWGSLVLGVMAGPTFPSFQLEDACKLH